MADGILRLKEYGAAGAIFDIEYIDNSPPGVDAVYLERGLPGDFSETFSGINANVRDLMSAFAEGRIDRSGAVRFAEDLSALIARGERSLLEKARGIARNNDEYLARASALFGHSWATLNLQTQTLSGEQALRRPLAEEKFSCPVKAASGLQADRADSGEPYVDVLAPIPSFMEAAEGAGFTNSFVDRDGVRRRLFLVRNIRGHWYLQLAFAPLVDYLGNPELILEPGRLTLRGAEMPEEPEPRDLVIPLDARGAMLLDWPGTSYRNSYTHLSFAELFFLETDELQMDEYVDNLAAAGLAFFAQYDEALGAAYALLARIHSALSASSAALARALEEAGEGGPGRGDAAFAEHVGLKAEARNLIHRLAALDTVERIRALAETLARSLTQNYPAEAAAVHDEAAFIAANLEYLWTILAGIEERETRIRDTLAGKICILGRVDTGSTDFGVNPFFEKYENPGSHGVLLDTILSEAFITPRAPVWSGAAALLLVPLLVLLLSPLRPALRSVLGLCGALLILALSFGLFALTGIFSGVLSPVLAMLLAVVIREINAYVGSEHEKQFIRKAFSTYLSSDVVEEIIADPSHLQLGGVKRRMTAVFTDVQGFSTISEHLDPEDLVRLLNRYLTAMSNEVLAEKGTIDKYEGDAIIAFFGAPLELPDHALRACVSAIAMKRAERAMNADILAEGLSTAPLLTRIGINTGSMVAGNMGTENKMNYTIMGNAVNLASRLEGVNKQYGAWILASGDTIRETGGQILSRRLDRVRVVGINQPVQLHEVLGLSKDTDDALREQTELFNQALAFFESRDWNAALRGFGRLLDSAPNDGPALLYFKRCREYLRTPPQDDWDGVFNLTEK